jgi:cellobiose-specific phosphotransferase system component IIC
MKDILDKIGTYNIFNYLLPGVLFAVLVSQQTKYNLVQQDVLAGAFVYYFIGSVVSRIGSLVVEPLFKRVRFVSFAPYSDFVSASIADPKIEILSEANNMYRTICALFVCVAITYGYESAAERLPHLNDALPVVLVVGLLVLFSFSYKKQTAYINKRISAHRNGGY